MQLFPQILAAIALFLLFTDLGEIVPAIGLNTILGYSLVLCGFALGQVWLIKGLLRLHPPLVGRGGGHGRCRPRPDLLQD